ncbi:hypothetical protein CDAR_71531 [Caerostris darwini]|uniref:Reverse transcriptase Ty1/copia-type domain-containing protein n=1 Tax=Caerostris darwini TaxID=1538125 RepID=A0AAV4NJ46_9ARAC|nr:hypothetical protein CDAR_71531 [Caerostris darwini]
MADEIQLTKDREAREQLPPPKNSKVIGCIWVYTLKKNDKGAICRYKARKSTESERIESKRRKIEVMRLYRKSDNVKAHDRERKRIARSKPETRARQNALQRERRALKRQQAINPHDDNIKHTKCV